MTAGRPRLTRETADYARMMTRMVRAHGRRVQVGNLEDLADLVRLRAELDEQIDQAARALHEGTGDNPGHSWTEIGRVLGITRQSARERFTRPRPGQPE